MSTAGEVNAARILPLVGCAPKGAAPCESERPTPGSVGPVGERNEADR